MIQVPVNQISQQFDDYLDLLNYAKQLGDVLWQYDILRTLETLYNQKEEKSQEDLKEQLWKQFDQVNTRMMDLYGRIHRINNEEQKQLLLMQIWELKLERLMLSKQIKLHSA